LLEWKTDRWIVQSKPSAAKSKLPPFYSTCRIYFGTLKSILCVKPKQTGRTYLDIVYFQNFLQNRNSSIFVCIWQILSNYGLIRVKRFVSSIPTKQLVFIFIYI
jgi:hypothetical protein